MKLEQLQESVTQVNTSVTQVKDQLLAKVEQKFSFSGSKTGKRTAVESVLDAMKVAGLTPIPMIKFKPLLRNKSYNPYTGWYASAKEDDVAPLLRDHVQHELERYGVKFGQGGFQLKDVRAQHNLGFSVGVATGRLVFEGGCDAVVVPWGELRWQKQLRVVFDWKRPQDLVVEKVLSGTQQAQLEMLGALAHSHHPALVVFTDCCNFIGLQPFNEGFRYLQTLHASDPGYFSPDDAFRLVVHHLTEVCSSNPLFMGEQTGLAFNSELKQQLQPLLRVQQLLEGGDGLAEQLQAVKFLPEDEQLDAAAELIMAWRGGTSFAGESTSVFGLPPYS